jgi:secernin
MCDTVVSVANGEVLFAKNSDRDANEAQLLEWHPARDLASDNLRCTWRSIPQVEHTAAIVISRPYWMWGAEMGANEHGVVIGNEAVFTKALLDPDGLLGMDLLRLGLERSTSAEEAVQVIRSLCARYGQGGRMGYDDADFSYSSSFLVADRSGAFVLETAGRESVVEAITEGTRAISNQLTIAPFADRYDDHWRAEIARSDTRRACMERLAGPSARAMAEALRHHEQDAPRYHPISGAMAEPCMHAGGLFANSQTVASWISRLTPDAIEHFATATSAPCLSAFKPIAIDTPVDVGQPTGLADMNSTWWRFEQLHRALIGNPQARRAWQRERDDWERRTFDQQWPSSADAFAAWHMLVASQSPVPSNDERPAIVRRHWQQRAKDAEAATAKLPAWR